MSKSTNTQEAASENSDDEVFVFGYGSIMNSATHKSWLTTTCSSTSTTTSTTPYTSSSMRGMAVELLPSFGYQREWNFQSATGFTALGVVQSSDHISSNEEAPDSRSCAMNGVVFAVPKPFLPGFDKRETGYDRIAIPPRFMRPWSEKKEQANEETSKNESLVAFMQKSKSEQNKAELPTIWMYVPQKSQSPDETHPLLQSYVDTVMQGCLEWGGEAFCQHFLESTGQWSSFFLNDTPSSRRPWLFRGKDYALLDRLLETSPATQQCFRDRKHPEEFASSLRSSTKTEADRTPSSSSSAGSKLKGAWGLPRRNTGFVGRKRQLDELESKLMMSSSSHPSNDATITSAATTTTTMISKVQVSGMGGVGKTQLVSEYCHRQYYDQCSYGLVLWLNSESSESLVTEFHQVLLDMTTATIADSDNARENKSKLGSPSTLPVQEQEQSTSELIGQIKTRLFRSQVPWLLVFDNLEDMSLLDRFCPRGTAGRLGHVLITTRISDPSRMPTLELGCLTPDESIDLLQEAAGSRNMMGMANQRASQVLCASLGYLPLALGMVAAYMQQCDLTCSEYLEQYQRSERADRSMLLFTESSSNSKNKSTPSTGGSMILHDYTLSVSASLSLSLDAIQRENIMASAVVHLLAFLGPDLITKSLLRTLLKVKRDIERQEEERVTKKVALLDLCKKGSVLGCVLASCILLLRHNRRATSRLVQQSHQGITSSSEALLIAWTAAGAGYLAATWNNATHFQSSVAGLPQRSVSQNGLDEFSETDGIWKILKSYSLLKVKDGKGSLHRLLSQSLREAQHKADITSYQRSLMICLRSIDKLWQFNPHDSETWDTALPLLEHLKALVARVAENSTHLDQTNCLLAAKLSTEAGIFSAMSLNAFVEAHSSFDTSLKLVSLSEALSRSKKSSAGCLMRAQAWQEQGRVFRYQGHFAESEKALLQALEIRTAFSSDAGVLAEADTLHELGVLEMKKSNISQARFYLNQSLAIRRKQSRPTSRGDFTAGMDAAATLHQLAAVCVAEKPPSLKSAETLLQESLRSSHQKGPRAATMKQLARVTMRQGRLDRAGEYLDQALELYLELYGTKKKHINVAAVRFQQGALAMQTNHFSKAWEYFSECLAIRRHVYAYARLETTPTTVGGSHDGEDLEEPIHLEVSSVLHKLGILSFAQHRYSTSHEMFVSERVILERLEDVVSTNANTPFRLQQARLTNLTWLRKCAKELGKDEDAADLTVLRNKLRVSFQNSNKNDREKESDSVIAMNDAGTNTVRSYLDGELLRNVLKCRDMARKTVLEKTPSTTRKEKLLDYMQDLARDLLAKEAPRGACVEQSLRFCQDAMHCLTHDDGDSVTQTKRILGACDALRNVLRTRGIAVNDGIVITP